jgi:hypothetical protein
MQASLRFAAEGSVVAQRRADELVGGLRAPRAAANGMSGSACDASFKAASGTASRGLFGLADFRVRSCASRSIVAARCVG